MNGTVKRSIFGVIFLAVMLGGLLFNKYLFSILFFLITCGLLYEFFKMNRSSTGNKEEERMGLIVSFSGAALFLFSFFAYDKPSDYPFPPVPTVAVFLIVLFLGIAVRSIIQSDKYGIRDTLPFYAGLIYIALPMALSNAVVFRGGEYSGLLMVAFFCIIWASDVGAYCFGMLLGQKVWPAKMCPSISPKKSWAGFIGGMLMAMLAGYILYKTGLFAFPVWHALIVAAIMHVMGVFGDLFESLWKRAAGIKDSGNIIPGHGGLMDRFDSALFAIPAGYIYLLLFELV